MSERNVLLKNVKHPFLVGLHYSFQTADKLYFVLDYINGGEVSSVISGLFMEKYLYLRITVGGWWYWRSVLSVEKREMAKENRRWRELGGVD